MPSVAQLSIGINTNAINHGAINPSTALDKSDLCAAAAFEAERILQLPAYILQAIALTESGTWDARDRKRKPWPWAVGAQGKSHYFDNKEQAINFVQNLKEQDINNIDIGCMQINLRYHGKTFASLSEAFNPINNVAYAGTFLKELYHLKNTWTESVKFYHSATPKYNRVYIQSVFKNWKLLRQQAKEEPKVPQLGLDNQNKNVTPFIKPVENTNERLPENKINQEIQSILQPRVVEKDASIQSDILRYDAFARVQAAQKVRREYDISVDSVPPSLVRLNENSENSENSE